MANDQNRTYPGFSPPPGSEFQEPHPVIEIPDPDDLPTGPSKPLVDEEDQQELVRATEMVTGNPRWKTALSNAIEKFPKSAGNWLPFSLSLVTHTNISTSNRLHRLLVGIEAASQSKPHFQETAGA